MRRRAVVVSGLLVLATGCGNDGVNEPTRVEGLEPARVIAAGTYHTCAVLRNGNLGCWGGNDYGQVGVPDGDEVYWSPRGIVLEEDPVDVAAGAVHTCAAFESGAVRCWGDDTEGFLGTAEAAACESNGMCPTGPALVTSVTGATRVAAAGLYRYDSVDILGYSCAVREDRTVVCWGDNREKQLGRGSSFSGSVGVLPDVVVDSGNFPLRVAKVSAGAHRACALDETPRVFCWGQGVGTAARVPELDGALDIAVGQDHACGVAASGAVLCWGSNINGQSAARADADTCSTAGDCVHAPTVVRGVSGAVSVSLGGRHSCALTASGDVVCWGSNQFGQLGRGAANLEGEPRRATMPKKAIAVASGLGHTCAIATDGAVYCWGLGSGGQLGRRP